MAGMAVYRTPPPPPAWAGADIVRIVDPLGFAIAWVAPAVAGACIGFSVREDTASPWRSVFESGIPNDDAPLGIEPLVRLDDGTVVPARLAGMAWTMLERDPISVIATCEDCLTPHTVAVTCEDGAMEFTLTGDGFAGARLLIPNADIPSGPDESASLSSQSNSAVLVAPDATLTLAWTADLTMSIFQAGAPHIDLHAVHGRPYLAPISIRLALRTSTDT